MAVVCSDDGDGGNGPVPKVYTQIFNIWAILHGFKKPYSTHLYEVVFHNFQVCFYGKYVVVRTLQTYQNTQIKLLENVYTKLEKAIAREKVDGGGAWDKEMSKYSHKMSEIDEIDYLIAFGYLYTSYWHMHIHMEMEKYCAIIFISLAVC